MTTITLFAFYHTTCGEGKPIERKDNPHKVAQCVGKTLAALGVIGGMISLYALSIYGAFGMGPFARIGFNANVAIFSSLAGLELFILTGMVFKALDCKKKKESHSESLSESQGH